MDETVERVTPGTESWKKYGFEHLQRYQFFASLYAGKKVLDAACGTGYGTNYIASGGASSALGIDISKEAILYSQEHYRLTNLQYRLYDLSLLGALELSPDLVVSFETIEHLQDPEKFIADVARLLSAGGTFVCSTPNKHRHSDTGNVNPFHPSELDWSDFRRLFEKYFQVESCYHQTESVEYLRYLELKHELHQERARSSAFLLNRLELSLRKLLKKPFQPLPFYHPSLDDAQDHEIRIEKMDEPRPWHKTFIITGTRR